MARHILALDQGTTSTRAIVFDARGRIVAAAQRELQQHLPAAAAGSSTTPRTSGPTGRASAARRWREPGSGPATSRRIGITNQRETDDPLGAGTGRPIHNAIVWQDRRTARAVPRAERATGSRSSSRARTGLVLDAYFSAPSSPGCSTTCPARARRGRARRARLRHGRQLPALAADRRPRRTPPTPRNASAPCCSTSARQDWDDELLRRLRIPRAVLPEVRDCAGELRRHRRRLSAPPLPIAGIAGDQQAATFGQACFAPGMAKNTYGTGCFVLLNTGDGAGRARATGC